jgi:hypothetical protein
MMRGAEGTRPADAPSGKIAGEPGYARLRRRALGRLLALDVAQIGHRFIARVGRR